MVKFPDEYFMNFLYLRTEGNPLRSIHYIQNMIRQKHLMIKNENTNEVDNKWMDEEVLYISDHLKKIIELEDMLTVDSPNMAYQINGPVMDKLASTKDGCLDMLLMKCASEIGKNIYLFLPFLLK